MSQSSAILPANVDRRSRRVSTLFTATVALVFAVTGAGLFEGNVVYPSWYDLASFDGFAEYHSAFGLRLLPFLPVPLLVATVLNGLLLRWRPPAVPLPAVAITFALQIGIGIVTVALAIPLQQQLGTPGHSPAEIVGLLDQLTSVSLWRDIPGVAVALMFVWMLRRQLLWNPNSLPVVV